MQRIGTPSDRLITIRTIMQACIVALLLTSCASIGTPDGGPYDETAPLFIGSTPPMGSANSSETRIKLYFDEYIKMENASEKVIVSPPQLNQPEISVNGRDILIKLTDSLRPNTTYTVDFSDAIQDNNEGNPLGKFTYFFSTGHDIDTMEVSGVVLAAENLEPIKGILVGLHADLADSAFTTQPFLRVGRTDDDGRFTIKGVAKDKSYRIYALKDADGDFRFTQKSEMIAVGTDVLTPSFVPAVRTDTAWRDSTHYDSIAVVHYTRFMPDDIILRAFTETSDNRYLLKTERLTPQSFTLFFTAASDSMPNIEGMGFDARTALMADANATRDSITYWVCDTALLRADTLALVLTYDKTDDSTLIRSNVSDTLELVPRTSLGRQREALDKEIEKWEKNREKAERRGEMPPAEPRPRLTLPVTYNVRSVISPVENPKFTLGYPAATIDTSRIHLWLVEDSTRTPAAYRLISDSVSVLSYTIFGEWRPGQNYRIEVDSAAFVDIYGQTNDSTELRMSVGGEDTYGTLFVRVQGMDSSGVVELLSATGSVAMQARCSSEGTAEFYYIRPGKYYMRMFVDANGNGRWDTGEYAKGLPPEMVYYYNEQIDVPARWDVERTWNPTDVRLDNQKPKAIIKQKSGQKKVSQNRNAERERNKNA